ncbi:MAG: DUF998 domain-containing protein [Bauldia sp.]
MAYSTTLGGVAIVGALVTLVAIGGVHFVATDKNPLHDPVSDYGAGPHRRWYWAGVAGVSIAALALVLAALAGVSAAPPVAIVLLVLFAVARVAIAWFPTDVGVAIPTTATGRIHGALAIVAFASVAIAANGYPGVSPWFGWALYVTVALLLLCLLWPPARAIFGLLERLFYVAMIAWFVAAGRALIG